MAGIFRRAHQCLASMFQDIQLGRSLLEIQRPDVPRFYIASGLENRASVTELKEALINLGFTISYDWAAHGAVKHLGPQVVRETSVKEVDGVVTADFIVVLMPGGRGTHVELGVALALGKPVYFFTAAPILEQERLCAFHLHPLVMEFNDLGKMMDAIVANELNRSINRRLETLAKMSTMALAVAQTLPGVPPK